MANVKKSFIKSDKDKQEPVEPPSAITVTDHEIKPPEPRETNPIPVVRSSLNELPVDS